MTVTTGTTFYPRNDTTVDTGTGVDVRVLAATNGGTDDVTQTVTASNTNDNVERTFDPGTAGDTTVADATVLQKKGWALRLTEDMTPTDDTNCNAALTAGTITVPLDVGLSWSGAILANPAPTFKVGLFRYNPATDTGTLIGSGTVAGSWNALSGSGTFQTLSATVNVASLLEFQQGEIFMLQVGLNTGTLPNPLVGSVTYTFTLRINNATTRVDLAAGQHFTTLCAFSGSSPGASTVDGLASKVLGTTGDATGLADAPGVLGSIGGMVGDAAGAATPDGRMSAVAGTVGAAAGLADAPGVLTGIGAMTGDAAGATTADGVLGAIGGFVGVAAGLTTADGVLGAIGGLVGDAAGTATADGLMSSISGTVGAADGAALVDGRLSSVLGTVGVVEIGAAGSTEVVVRPLILIPDD